MGKKLNQSRSKNKPNPRKTERWKVVVFESSHIKLPSLEFRQLRGDMIQVFKIANNYYDTITTKSLFNFSNNTRLRGHNLKIIKQTVNKSKYANFFTNRVVNTWNKLPSHIVNAKSINEFKNLFDEHNKEYQYKINFD